jgi:hypothetical protein
VQRAQPVEKLIVIYFFSSIVSFVAVSFLSSSRSFFSRRESMFLGETLRVYLFHVSGKFANGVPAAVVERVEDD